MNEIKRVTTFLPGFGGFHGTQWENLFPFSLEMCAERFAMYEEEGPTVADIGAILRQASEASRFFDALARSFCRGFDVETSRWLGFELGLTYSGFDIPAAHNGTTDFILATMPADSARKLVARSAEEGHRRLIQTTRDRVAFQGDADAREVMEQWLAEPVERWGRGALCDLLAGFVDPEIDERLYSQMTNSGDIPAAFEGPVDWARFSELLAARRFAPSPPVATPGPQHP